MCVCMCLGFLCGKFKLCFPRKLLGKVQDTINTINSKQNRIQILKI